MYVGNNTNLRRIGLNTLLHTMAMLALRNEVLKEIGICCRVTQNLVNCLRRDPYPIKDIGGKKKQKKKKQYFTIH